MITNQNTSESALKLNVNNARSGLLYHWIGLLKAETFVVCTAQPFTVKNARDCSLTVWRKPFNGEHTMRKICYQNTEFVVRKSLFSDQPSETCRGGSLADYNAVFEACPQEVAKC